MLYDYDYTNQIIDIPYGTTEVLILTLISDIRNAESTANGVTYGQIATASGNESLGGTVAVGITVNLLDNWQIRFAAGNYVARVSGGNLVGGPGGDPIAYSVGVQVLLLQSAASTTVLVNSGGSGLSTEQNAKLMSIPSDSWAKVIEAGLSAEELMRLISAVLIGKCSGANGDTITFLDLLGVKPRVIASVDSDGNRTGIIKDAT
jgi:hypothetical protein